MKCKDCIAIVNVGNYEYPEEACCVTNDDDIIEFKDGSCGCHRRSFKKLERDIKKQKEIELKAWTKDASDFVKFVKEREEKENGKINT